MGASGLEGTLERVLATPLSDLVARPWFDRFAFWALMRWYVPLSRLWAAGTAAHGNVDAFAENAGLTRLGRAERRLAAVLLDDLGRAARSAHDADARWESGLFESAATGEEVAMLERERQDASHAFMVRRVRFVPFLRGLGARRVAWRVPRPDDAAVAWRAVLDDPAAAFAVPVAPPVVRRSSACRAANGGVSWVRFASPSAFMGDSVTARVTEPAAPRLTLIVGHGLLVDSELWQTSVGVGDALADIGCRVIEPASPWHGRRMVPGSYGGEPFIATAPVGPLALLLAQVAETAVLVDWCRDQFGGPVAVAGASMSSFATQLVVSHCGGWPAPFRPDAALAMVHHGRPGELLSASMLARGFGADRALPEAGWTPAALGPWNDAIAAAPSPALPPERFISVVGLADTITPFPGAKALCDAWRVPESNRYILPGGHFSTALSTMRDRKALERLVAVATR